LYIKEEVFMPKIFFHKHAKQYTVCINRVTHYLGKDENDAKTKYHQLMLDFQKDNLSRKGPRPMHFSKLCDLFLDDDYMQYEINRFSYHDYVRTLSLFCKMFPDLKSNEIDRIVINKYNRFLLTKKDQGQIRKKRGVSPRRAKKHIMYIKRVLNWALENDVLKPSDVTFPKLKREVLPRKIPVFLSKDEINALMSYENNIPKFCNKKARKNVIQTLSIIKFILSTGRRIQEVINLKKKDFNFNLNIYHITKHKTEKTDPRPKVFVLSQRARSIVKPLTDNIHDNDYVFSNDDGSKLKTTTLGQRLKRILKNLGIKNIAFKELRHSFATHMLMCGASLKVIQELLGHTSIKSTEVYAHVTNDYLKKAIENPLYNKMF